MSEFLLTVKDESKSRFIMTLLKEFDYVNVRRKKAEPRKLSSDDKRILRNLEKAVEEVNLARQGKVELQDAFEMIAELREELKNEGYHAD
jgi:hypothetical protein